MKVRLRNPDREVELSGPRSVRDVLSELAIDQDTVLVIRDRTLLTREERVARDDELEIRPVISAQFFLGYLDRAAELFAGLDRDADSLSPCERCGQPTTGRYCAFCRARAQVLGGRLAPPADEQVVRELADEVLPAEVHGR